MSDPSPLRRRLASHEGAVKGEIEDVPGLHLGGRARSGEIVDGRGPINHVAQDVGDAPDRHVPDPPLGDRRGRSKATSRASSRRAHPSGSTARRGSLPVAGSMSSTSTREATPRSPGQGNQAGLISSVGGKRVPSRRHTAANPGRSVSLRIDLGMGGLPRRSAPSSPITRRLTDWSVTCHGRHIPPPSQLPHLRKVGTELSMHGPGNRLLWPWVGQEFSGRRSPARM